MAEHFKGVRVENPIFGEVLIGKAGFHHLYEEGATERRRIIAPAITTAIEHGELVSYDNFHKGKNHDTAVLAAVVKDQHGTQYLVGVVLVQASQNNKTSYYYHDAIIYEIKENATVGDTILGGRHHVPTYSNRSSVYKILKDIELVKRGIEAERSTTYGPRFQLEDVSVQNEQMRILVQQNQRMARQVEELRDSLRTMQEDMNAAGTAVDSKAVRGIARQLIDQYGTGTPLRVLTQNLQTAFDAMANARNSGDCAAAMAAMGDIALDLIEKNLPSSDQTEDEGRQHLRQWLRGTYYPSVGEWNELMYRFSDWNGLRAAFKGTGMQFRKPPAWAFENEKAGIPAGNWRTDGGKVGLDAALEGLRSEFPGKYDGEIPVDALVQAAEEAWGESANKYDIWQQTHTDENGIPENTAIEKEVPEEAVKGRGRR